MRFRIWIHIQFQVRVCVQMWVQVVSRHAFRPSLGSGNHNPDAWHFLGDSRASCYAWHTGYFVTRSVCLLAIACLLVTTVSRAKTLVKIQFEILTSEGPKTMYYTRSGDPDSPEKRHFWGNGGSYQGIPRFVHGRYSQPCLLEESSDGSSGYRSKNIQFMFAICHW